MGNQVGIIIRNVKNELFHYAKRLILNEVKGIECLHKELALTDLIQRFLDDKDRAAKSFYSKFNEEEIRKDNIIKEENKFLFGDIIGKQSFRAVLCTLIYISTFVPNLNFGQDEHKRRRQVLCLNGSQIPNRVQEQEPSRVL